MLVEPRDSGYGPCTDSPLSGSKRPNCTASRGASLSSAASLTSHSSVGLHWIALLRARARETVHNRGGTQVRARMVRVHSNRHRRDTRQHLDFTAPTPPHSQHLIGASACTTVTAISLNRNGKNCIIAKTLFADTYRQEESSFYGNRVHSDALCDPLNIVFRSSSL